MNATRLSAKADWSAKQMTITADKRAASQRIEAPGSRSTFCYLAL
jgi:hypothetical protein